MSSVGNNIRKIRGVKKLSQSDFAAIFDLKRGAVGAYEEGRSEPKIDMIIDIAKYFSIGLDDLLTKELSVNDLYRFDIFRKDLSEQVNHNLIPSSTPIDIIPVPFVSIDQKDLYLKDRESISTFPSINLPLGKGKKYRAFELSDNSMNNNGLGPESGDIVIAHKPEKFEIAKLEIDRVYLFETEGDYFMRRMISKSISQIVVGGTALNDYQLTLAIKEIQGVWQVASVITKNIGADNSWTAKIREIENDMNLLKAKVNSNT